MSLDASGPLLALAGAILVAAISAAATLGAARHTTRGDVGTSTAESLWKTLRGELAASRDEAAKLRDEMTALRKESVALRDETLLLREEAIQLRADIVTLTGHLREATDKLAVRTVRKPRPAP
ncbi:MAG: hypothetical protein M3Y26_04545 [Actinomycetota bacterium]|nr:hypothetical protein [Actinomycetota bacterium]